MLRLGRVKRPAWPFLRKEASPTPRNHADGFRRLILIAIGVVFVAGLVYWIWHSQWVVTTGRVMAKQVQITSPLKGRVNVLSVQEGEKVRKGQLLARLDDAELSAELRREQAQAEQVRARLRGLKEIGVAPAILSLVTSAKRDLHLARQRYSRARAELNKARLKYREAKALAERWKRLLLLRAVTHGEWEQRVLQLKAAEADVQAMRARVQEELASVRAARTLFREAERARTVAIRQLANERETLRQELAQAEASVDVIRSRLNQLVLHAPQDGVIAWIPRKVGEIVDYRDPVVVLMVPEDLWVEAYVDGEDLNTLQEGQEAYVKIEGLTDEYVAGRLSLVYPAERPADRVFRIGPDEVRSARQVASLSHPVKIHFVDPFPPGLQPEMVAYVWIARQ